MARKPKTESEKPQTKARRPRPDDFPTIFHMMAVDGNSLRQACRKLGIDQPSVSAVIREDEALRHQYTHAREALGELDAENVLTTARACMAGQIPPDRARVAIDAFKWAAGQRAPKQWGQSNVRVTGEDGGAIKLEHSVSADSPLERLTSRIAGLIASDGTSEGS